MTPQRIKNAIGLTLTGILFLAALACILGALLTVPQVGLGAIFFGWLADLLDDSFFPRPRIGDTA
jgi:hypothetical protein